MALQPRCLPRGDLSLLLHPSDLGLCSGRRRCVTGSGAVPALWNPISTETWRQESFGRGRAVTSTVFPAPLAVQHWYPRQGGSSSFTALPGPKSAPGGHPHPEFPLRKLRLISEHAELSGSLVLMGALLQAPLLCLERAGRSVSRSRRASSHWGFPHEIPSLPQ